MRWFSDVRRVVRESWWRSRQRWKWMQSHHRTGQIRLTPRQWIGLAAFAAVSLFVAWGTHVAPQSQRLPAATVTAARTDLDSLTVRDHRPPHDSNYNRASFGPAWTDDASVVGAGNACDTRNDILSRDLAVTARTPINSCPEAVAAGSFTSPYTGRRVIFARGRGSASVQIDHVVPLAYAWDMGARDWPAGKRWAMANDPANLVATDAASNQEKSDAEPARWMPPLRGFHCQYAVAFISVLIAYQLPIDAPSKKTLKSALGNC
ncbi:MAG: HNH endonuclease family protein [Gordonia sp. (in: high G+C Gram-positive bacteria)]|uniref:HNH endonuclease family protein n=2 Tax=Gordonia sp. (in: high G+C Gram-positive bacteria) TaxID=84139 RepID=UPI003C7211DA